MELIQMKQSGNLLVSAPPLQQQLLCKTNDLDEVRECMEANLAIPHSIKALNKVPISVDSVFHAASLSRISVNYFSYGFEAEIGINQLGHFMIDMPLSGVSYTRCRDGEYVIKPGLASVASPNDILHIKLSSECSKLFVLIERPALEGYLSELLGRDLPHSLVFATVMDLSSAASASWWRTVQLLVAELENQESLLNTAPHADAQFEQMLMWTILHAQSHNYTSELNARQADTAPHYVRKVEEYIGKRCIEAITLDELVSVSGVSSRTLFDSFRRYKGISPMKLLKLTRLERANRVLKESSPHKTSVTEIAETWGFSQLGKFSVLYKTKYGESPSETLKR